MDRYCISRFNCVRTPSREVMVGNVGVGGANPVRIQSMTNAKTQDVEASVKQCIALAEAGCEIIRLTAQNLDASKALGDISKKFRAAGFSNPLVADIHFLPQTAMEAVKHVEKIRVNPGNFSDKKKFNIVEYTDAEYEEELARVREKFEPLVLRCKELGRAMRIGTNHGSLSDRIISRYGDTPLGMVEAAFEFARICRDMNYNDFVFSFKASNTRIMTHTYRLAARMMAEQNFNAPLHLGVTEAGFGEDARIKSSIGICGLLFDGLGDTIRVSLTEDPTEEIPVAKEFVRLAEKVRAEKSVAQVAEDVDFYSYKRRECADVQLVGIDVGQNRSPAVAVFGGADERAEFSFNADGTSADSKKFAFKKLSATDNLNALIQEHGAIAAEIKITDLSVFADAVKSAPAGSVALVPPSATDGRHAIGEARAFAAAAKSIGINCPIFLNFDESKCAFPDADESSKLNEASVYLGSLLTDGIGDIAAIKISGNSARNVEACLAILQGARARKSKAEYIACPSCGRTLFDIQTTASKIEARTKHLKDLTIAVMGCIVNGPGEMSDADFGYVGGAPGKINLYKNKECVEIGIPENEAIEHLIALIKKHGRWTDI